MAKYQVYYGFELTEDYIGPGGEQFARGTMEIETDKDIETEADVLEVTKQVYRQEDKGLHKIKSLALENIYLLDDEGNKIELAE